MWGGSTTKIAQKLRTVLGLPKDLRSDSRTQAKRFATAYNFNFKESIVFSTCTQSCIIYTHIDTYIYTDK